MLFLRPLRLSTLQSRVLWDICCCQRPGVVVETARSGCRKRRYRPTPPGRCRLDLLELSGVDMIDWLNYLCLRWRLCSRWGHTVDLPYARFNQLSVDRQSNYVSDVRCGPTVNAKMPRRTILTRQHKVVFHPDLPVESKLRRVTKL